MAKTKHVAHIEKAFASFMQKEEYTPVLPVLIEEEKFELVDSFFSYTGIYFDSGIKKFTGKTINRDIKKFLKEVNIQWKVYKTLYSVTTNPKTFVLQILEKKAIKMFILTFILNICMTLSIHTVFVFYIFAILATLTLASGFYLYLKYKKFERAKFTLGGDDRSL